ncbi:hypothetical protein FFK22_041460 [Mycobacterium sp. KBS0706]|nr:hypothetical protein FFK22_041460 [Mycobacterium sp. KBS0706]
MAGPQPEARRWPARALRPMPPGWRRSLWRAPPSLQMRVVRRAAHRASALPHPERPGPCERQVQQPAAAPPPERAFPALALRRSRAAL